MRLTMSKVSTNFIIDIPELVGNMGKSQISKLVFQENKARQIFRKTIISYSLIRTLTYVCVSGGKKNSFFGKFGVLCFLEIPVLRFALLPYYRRTTGSFRFFIVFVLLP